MIALHPAGLYTINRLYQFEFSVTLRTIVNHLIFHKSLRIHIHSEKVIGDYSCRVQLPSQKVCGSGLLKLRIVLCLFCSVDVGLVSLLEAL